MGVQTLDVHSKPGYITLRNASGPPEEYPIAELLRAADIPVGLTHTQVDGIRLPANVAAILIRTLQGKEIIDETFADELGMDWDLNHLIYAVEQLGGSFENPDLDDVEEA